MTQDELNNKYFEWMYNLVFDVQYSKHSSYRKLLTILHDTDFDYIIIGSGPAGTAAALTLAKVKKRIAIIEA